MEDDVNTYVYAQFFRQEALPPFSLSTRHLGTGDAPLIFVFREQLVVAPT